ncbi:uncharacterized protein [Watersipora subatra]|uniref:uncharacterized protein n=1 Tax=Watersipora subatra TaxID=2589382 RepID=UPI00355C054F
MMEDHEQEPATEIATEESTDVIEQAASSDEPKKSVKFETNELSFDEAQAEIDAIKARAGQARENLKPSTTASSYKSSYSPYSLSSLEDDVPKSKNMLSHLNSNSAMISYKVTTARNLVQKQEALLRNLKTMRENMERSSVEISRASDYLSPVRVPARGYFEKRAESAPFISRRQVREVSPAFSAQYSIEAPERVSSKASSPTPVSFSTRISSLPTPISSSDYQPDADFEKEIAALRKRVSDLSSKANEPIRPRYSSFDYEMALGASVPEIHTVDINALSEPKLEVKNARTPKYVPKTHHISKPDLSSRAVLSNTHASNENGMNDNYLHSTYTNYLMESLKDLDTYPASTSLESHELYTDPLAATATSYPLAF